MTKFTPELAMDLCTARENGLPVKDCADFIGIHRDTVYRWLKKGENAKSGRYREFYKNWVKATSKFKLYHLKKINDSKDWRASQYLLSVTDPETFNTHNWRNVKAEVKSDVNLKTEQLFDEEIMDDLINEYDDFNDDEEK